METSDLPVMEKMSKLEPAGWAIPLFLNKDEDDKQHNDSNNGTSLQTSSERQNAAQLFADTRNTPTAFLYLADKEQYRRAATSQSNYSEEKSLTKANIPSCIVPNPNCPPGLEYLTFVDELLIHQQVELFEVFTGWETKNRYQIKNSVGQQVLFAIEESDICSRQCCGHQRSFILHITDNRGVEVARMIRKTNVLSVTCCCFTACFCSSKVCQQIFPNKNRKASLSKPQLLYNGNNSLELRNLVHEVEIDDKPPCDSVVGATTAKISQPVDKNSHAACSSRNKKSQPELADEIRNQCTQLVIIEAPPGVEIGRIRVDPTFFLPRFEILTQDRVPALTIEGAATMCEALCCEGSQEFKIYPSLDSSQPVGSINKQWTGLMREMFTDADNFSLTFPLDLDVKLKATLIGAVLLIDFQYFENNRLQNH